jgi:hypothetical protein
MKPLFLTTAAFAALVMIAPVGAHAGQRADIAAAAAGNLAHDQSAEMFTLEGTLMAAKAVCPAASVPSIAGGIRRIESDPFAAVMEHRRPDQVRQWRAAGKQQFTAKRRANMDVVACTDIEMAVAGADKEVGQ